MNRNIVQKTKDRYLGYEIRHQGILDAAIRLFNDKGYSGATTSEIAKSSGISEPILYKHFENKKALFQACYKSITQELFAEYRRIRRSNPDDEVAYLRGVTNVYVDFVRNNPDKSMFMAHMLSYKNDPEFSDDFRNLMESSITVVERVIESAYKKGLFHTKINLRFLATLFVSNYFQVLVAKDFVPEEEFTGENFIEPLLMMLGKS